MNSWKIISKNIVYAIPPTITFIDLVGHVARVDGRSMQPALNPKGVTDYVFLNSWLVASSEIRRGDVISFVSPKNPEQKIIKRVIGIGGDVISAKNGAIVHVPPHHFWVEGDHASHSLDSNSFGPVNSGLVTTKATAIVWPPSRWQRIKPELRYDRLPLNFVSSLRWNSLIACRMRLVSSEKPNKFFSEGALFSVFLLLLTCFLFVGIFKYYR